MESNGWAIMEEQGEVLMSLERKGTVFSGKQIAFLSLIIALLVFCEAGFAQTSASERKRRREEMRAKLEAKIQAEKERQAQMSEEERKRDIMERIQKERELREKKRRERVEAYMKEQGLLEQGNLEDAGTEEVANEEGAPPEAPAPALNMAPGSVLKVLPYHQVVQKGDRFATRIVLYSESIGFFDRVDIRLSYPPSVRPLQVFDYPIEDQLDPNVSPTLDRKKGMLSYTGFMARPVETTGPREILHVLWEAVRADDAVQLQLGGLGLPRDAVSAVWFEEDNLLDSNRTLGVACVNAGLRVISEAGEAFRQAFIPSKIRAQLDLYEGERVTLDLIGPRSRPLPGQEFEMVVYLQNPHEVAFDAVHLFMRFDPQSVEVIDSNAGNWIRRGVNISDADSHLLFPFNVHKRNEVSNRLGTIRYHMGFSTPRAVPGGELVRIHCRAKTTTAPDSFRLYDGIPGRNLQTQVLVKGQDVLLRPEKQAKPLASLSPN